MKQDMIVILDLGSQNNTAIARAVRELGVFSEIHPHDATACFCLRYRLRASMLLGGRFSKKSYTIRRSVILTRESIITRVSATPSIKNSLIHLGIREQHSPCFNFKSDLHIYTFFLFLDNIFYLTHT